MRVRGSGSESGSVLLWVMVVGLFAVGALGAATRLIPAGTRFTAQDADTTYALIAAESGVHYVMHYLDKHGPDALETLTGEWNAPGELGGTYRVVSDGEFVYVTGQFGNATRSLRARLTGDQRGLDVERDTRLQLDVAVFALAAQPSRGEGGAYLHIAGNSHVYGSVGTNSVQADAVQISGNPVRIDGSIIVGPAESPSDVVKTSPSHKSVGPIIPMEPREYPLPVFPEPFPSLPSREAIMVHNTRGTQAVVNESGFYHTISARGKENAVIFEARGTDLHVRTSHFEIMDDAGVEVRGDGRLFLYVEERLSLESSTFNDDGDASSVVIYYAGQRPVELKKGGFKGVIYARDADVDITGRFGSEAWVFTGGRDVRLGSEENGGNGKGKDKSGLGIDGIIYAPLGHVHVAGRASTGIVIGNSVKIAGASEITYRSLSANTLPIRFPHEALEERPNTLHWHVCWTDCLSEVQADEP